MSGFFGAFNNFGRLGSSASVTEASSFAPTDISNLALWLDASDAATITESGGSVSQWDDKSGNTNHVTQATGADQPTTGTRTINGLNVLDFAPNDHLDTTIDLTNATAFPAITFFAVFETDSIAAGTPYIFDQSPGSAGIAFRRDGAAVDLFVYNQSGTLQAISDAGSLTVATPTIFAVTITTSGFVLYQDGVQVGSNMTGFTSIGSAAGSPLVIGAEVDGTDGFDGKIGEFALYSRALTTSELNQVGNYFADTFGITWTDIV